MGTDQAHARNEHPDSSHVAADKLNANGAKGLRFLNLRLVLIFMSWPLAGNM
jgi:hypothetical protein